MSETLSTDEILRRMKAHVDTSNQSFQLIGTDFTKAKSVMQFSASAHSSSSIDNSRDFFPLRFEIDTAIEGMRQVGQVNPRRRGLHNDAIQFAKKVMRRSLAWYTRPIHYFQGAVIRALQQTLELLQGQEKTLHSLREEIARVSSTVAHYDEMLERMRVELTEQFGDKLAVLSEDSARLHREIDALRDAINHASSQYESRLAVALEPCSMRFREISDELGWVRGELARSQDELRETKLDGRVRDRNWRRFFHDIQAGTLQVPPPTVKVVSQAQAAVGNGVSDFDYFRFEEVYRGDEALIKERQKAYLEFFRDRDNVVDIGCGRGEFLEMLRANGIRAHGVELGMDQFLLCKEKGLDVAQQDLFAFLESVHDGSLGGLFSAQVIEHLSAADQLRFVALACKKTSPDSPVIFETINIQSLFALSRNFFLDPTHVRPVHPEMLKFAMESARFRNVELRYSGAITERRIPPLRLFADSVELGAFNRAVETLNDLVYGYLYYAAIGWH